MNVLVAVPGEAQLDPMRRAYAEAGAARRRITLIGGVLLGAAMALAWMGAEVDPRKFWQGLPNFGSYIGRLGHLDTGAYVWTDPVYWFWGLRRWSIELGQTILMAYIGTATGLAIGIVGGVLGSANLVRSAPLRFVVRRVLEFMRTVPDIVFALVFVVAFGLGPLPGVLAIALHTGGTLGKLFTEVV